jgi:hypothetical protein
MAERDRFLLRISPELMESIKRWADDELRSTNAQIEYILADAVRKAGRMRKCQPGESTDAPPAEAPTPAPRGQRHPPRVGPKAKVTKRGDKDEPPEIESAQPRKGNGRRDDALYASPQTVAPKKRR